MSDHTTPDDLAEAERYARQIADCDDERDWLPALLAEYDRRGQIEQRAVMVAGGRPARPDRHVALALSASGGPSPAQAAFTASWILTGEILARIAGAPASAALDGTTEPTEEQIERGARALFGLTRAAELSPNADRLWQRICADGDRPYFDQAEAVLRAALLASTPTSTEETDHAG